MSDRPAPARIHALTPQLANQIAAGEVVERPASVVKELLENSLDAGARRVEVEAEGGGIGLVRVRDDGCGIHRDDLLLGLSRHATSKLAAPADLEAVATLGFRGEALASIASVSRLRVVSRTGEDGEAWAVRCEGSADAAGPEPAAHPPGTTVEVRELFYNTPARRRFLRTERTEFGHLQEVVRRVALSRFDLDLVLQHNGRGILDLRAARDAAGAERRVAAVCGRAFLAHAVTVDLEGGGMRLWGWATAAGHARSQADLQYVYINGRVVRDRVLSHALRQAYGDTLYPGRHPAYVLHLELDPRQVDVNVHPTKHEVRFREARMVHDFIRRALRGALGGETGPADGAPVPHAPAGGTSVADGAEAYGELYGRQAEPAGTDWRVLGVLHDAFLVADGPEGPVLLDLRAAEARRLQRALERAAAGEGITMRPLLVPVQVPLPAESAAFAERVGTGWARFGLEVDRIGAEAVVVRRVPAVWGEVDPDRLLPPLLADLLAPEMREAVAGGGTEPLARVAARAAEAAPAAAPDGGRLEALLEAAAEAPSLRVALTRERLLDLLAGTQR